MLILLAMWSRGKTKTCMAEIFVELFTESHKWMWQILDGAISATRVSTLSRMFIQHMTAHDAQSAFWQDRIAALDLRQYDRN